MTPPTHQEIMNYLITAEQRKASHSTLYFEFQKGPFRNQHWAAHSVYLHADIFDRLDMYDLFATSIPDFDYYMDTQVSPSQYEVLKANAMLYGGEIAVIFTELDTWVTECFQQESCFTICGI